MCARQDLNLGPRQYQWRALPTELRALGLDYSKMKARNQLEKEEVRQTNDGIKEFENIYLKCTTKYGYPFPEMKWFKNNIEMYVQTNLCIMKYDRIYLLN